ncbi:MAG: 3-deoxy-manno-octulosonate cytidylyltransferase [Bacteroidales bacterium]|nr:3-deoxy-manno-octulosonate cytidylyltransferase [Bacteroidales bacterium]
MKFIGIIPARYASTRFPGKPLVDIGGKPMIQRVYEQASKALNLVIVATDDERIQHAVENFNGRVVMTSKHHKTGTDRCDEAIRIFRKDYFENIDVVINIQGDEPFIQPEQLKQLMDCFEDPSTQIATLIQEIEMNQDIFDPNLPKVAINLNNEAIYFSRSPIPFILNEPEDQWVSSHTFYKHIGTYAYRIDILQEITQLQPSSLEIAESLEQNRWIENGYTIKVKETKFKSYPVDTPEDLEKIKKLNLF